MTAENVRTGERSSVDLTNGSPESPQPDVSVEERMLALTYRVARQLGYSRRASNRICRNIFLGSRSPWCSSLATHPSDQQAGTDAKRGVRTLFLITLRTVMGPHVGRADLEHVLHAAVLCDEVELLPPRQRFAVRLAVLERCTVEQIVHRTGWTRSQVARLLRTGL